MKKAFFLSLFFATACGHLAAQQGTVVYALPATTIEIEAEAVHELFTAGPYARYAQKYLGIEAKVTNRDTFFLKNITVKTAVEADASQLYTLEIKDKNAAANFFRFSAEGLVVSFEQGDATAADFRFTNAAPAAFADRGVEANIGSERVTLYKTVQTERGFERVPTQQNQTVEKNPERRAEEAANVIFNLRKKRIDLITGEVDGAISGGLQTALDEIKRLEEEYLSLFLGKTIGDCQTAVFHVTPVAGQARQLYVAFRYSPSLGLLPADNMAGRPITLELIPDKKAATQPADIGGKQPRITYRIPAAMQARINDGQTTLLQTRLLVHQLGRTATFPVNLQVK